MAFVLLRCVKQFHVYPRQVLLSDIKYLTAGTLLFNTTTASSLAPTQPLRGVFVLRFMLFNMWHSRTSLLECVGLGTGEDANKIESFLKGYRSVDGWMDGGKWNGQKEQLTPLLIAMSVLVVKLKWKVAKYLKRAYTNFGQSNNNYCTYLSSFLPEKELNRIDEDACMSLNESSVNKANEWSANSETNVYPLRAYPFNRGVNFGWKPSL